MNNNVYAAYKALYAIYIGGEYVQQAINGIDADLLPAVTKLVYGVLENDVRLSYFIGKSFKKKPDNKTTIILKLGMYALEFMDGMPNYALINECVELTEKIGKKQLKGFVNAALKSFADKGIAIPADRYEKMSVEYSVPLWLVKAYCKQYGEETARNIMKRVDCTLEHARPNARKLSKNELKEIFINRNIEFIESPRGFFVQNGKAVRYLFDLGMLTFQSLSSIYAAEALDVSGTGKILDLCAAPGGKSVMLSEIAPDADITACEIHEHRIELINKYASRMSADNVNAVYNDAAVKNENFTAAFDYVLCDVPCSGLGVAHKKPDIYLRKTMTDIENLAELQYKILNNAIDYAKEGGAIVYSTCTTLREENYNVIGRTLKYRKDVKLEKMDIPFENNGFIQLLPDDKIDGFFIAKLRKSK